MTCRRTNWAILEAPKEKSEVEGVKAEVYLHSFHVPHSLDHDHSEGSESP